MRQFNDAHFARKESQSGTEKRAAVQQKFRREAVEQMNVCNKVELACELGVCRRVLYNWRDRFGKTDPPPPCSRELILRKHITKLKKLLANKILEVDFFRHACKK